MFKVLLSILMTLTVQNVKNVVSMEEEEVFASSSSKSSISISKNFTEMESDFENAFEEALQDEKQAKELSGWQPIVLIINKISGDQLCYQDDNESGESCIELPANIMVKDFYHFRPVQQGKIKKEDFKVIPRSELLSTSTPFVVGIIGKMTEGPEGRKITEIKEVYFLGEMPSENSE